jgi:hypothetical protein
VRKAIFRIATARPRLSPWQPEIFLSISKQEFSFCKRSCALAAILDSKK